MSKEQLIDLDKKQIDLLKKIIKRCIPVKTVWAYGSRVTWNADERSDLDVAVFDCSPAEIGNLKEALGESNLLISVDVMDWQNIPEKFRTNIKKKYVVIQRGLKEWREVKLGEVAFFKTGKLNSNAEKPEGIYPFFTCSPETLKIDDYAFDEEALILAGNNANGIFSLKYYKGKFNAYQRTYVINLNGKHVEYKFLFYALKIQLADLVTISHGTVTKYLTLPILNNIKIFLPPLPEQKAIAEVLSSLDDKIDLLHRQNKTLEDMAQALFRKWFVEGADEGWEEIELGKLVKCTTGHSYRSTELQPSNIALVTLKNFARNGSFRMDGYKEFVGKFKDSQIVKQGDLVVSHTDITQEADIIGNPALVVHPDKYDTLVMTMDLMKVESAEKWLSKEFLFYLFKSRQFKSHCLGCSNGTTVLHMSRKAIPSYRFKIPNKKKTITFASIVKPNIDKIFSNIYNIKILENLRDILLPKLMSGIIRIKQEKTEIIQSPPTIPNSMPEMIQ